MNAFDWNIFALLSQQPSCSMDEFALAHPEVAALRGVPQDPTWHPEGDVFVHTGLVLDRAAELRRNVEHPAVLMLAALCHDLGKPSCTVRKPSGRIIAHGHEAAGVPPTHALLARIGAPVDVAMQVAVLVHRHLAPAMYPTQAKRKGYRRLAGYLNAVGVRPELLAALSKADQWGRTTVEADLRDDSAQVAFLEQYRRYNDAN